MQADFAVELGAEDETLAVPWSAPDGLLRFYDLRRNPELLLLVSEAGQHRELAEFLASVNSPRSRLQTAKCDAWFSGELTEEEAIYGASCKFGSYVDLFFVDPAEQMSFPGHEQLADRLTRLLKRAPEVSAAAEFLIRRCFYALRDTGEGAVAAEDPGAADREGFYVTFYLFGYGDDEADARRRWGIGLKLVENAILQVSAERPPSPRPAGETGARW